MPFDSSELQKITEAGRVITKAAGLSFEQWAEGEMGLVLKGATAYVSAATPEQAETRARARTLRKLGLTKGQVTINVGMRGPEGREWIRSPKTKKFRLAGMVGHNAGPFEPVPDRHFSNTQWGTAQDAVKNYQGRAGFIAIAKRTIGLARQSLLQMGDAVGILLERVAGAGGLSAGDLAQARLAVGSDGKTHVNGTGRREKRGGWFSIEVVNRYPKARQAKIDTALETAIAQRAVIAEQVLEQKLLAGTQQATGSLPYVQVVR